MSVEPYYEDEAVTIYHGDCREILPTLEVDVLVTDPPYPNNAGHFDAGIAAAREVLTGCRKPAIVFWDEMETPPVPLPLVARHVWHRTNTNRPDNYEAIYEFADGPRRASRVYPFAVIYPGLTGCHEATGHPTQKNLKLMQTLIARHPGTVLDPFAGSGTTLEAAKRLGRRAIGIEIEERYCEIAARRMGQEVLDLGVAA
jgi:site-specific DNA-methyltransferase (adenine-specific)